VHPRSKNPGYAYARHVETNQILEFRTVSEL